MIMIYAVRARVKDSIAWTIATTSEFGYLVAGLNLAPNIALGSPLLGYPMMKKNDKAEEDGSELGREGCGQNM